MLRLEDLAAWLKAAPQSATEPVRYNRQPNSPDAVITLTDTGGFEMSVEWAFDRPSVQVRCRGSTGTAARDLAHRIDRLLLDAQKPFSLGAYRVIDVGRVGGAPAYMETDERDRTTYTANYWLEIER